MMIMSDGGYGDDNEDCGGEYADDGDDSGGGNWFENNCDGNDDDSSEGDELEVIDGGWIMNGTLRAMMW